MQVFCTRHSLNVNTTECKTHVLECVYHSFCTNFFAYSKLLTFVTLDVKIICTNRRKNCQEQKNRTELKYSEYFHKQHRKPFLDTAVGTHITDLSLSHTLKKKIINTCILIRGLNWKSAINNFLSK